MTITDKLPTLTCNCRFNADVGMHDRMLSFESLAPVEAAATVAHFVLGESFVIMSPDELNPDPSDFRTFVSQHNWSDPVAMSDLAEVVDEIATRAFRD